MTIRLPSAGFLKKSLVLVAIAAPLGAYVAPAAAEEDVIEIVAQGRSEMAYAADVRDELSRTMHFPTGREASLTHPEGLVSVWFVLSRDGAVVARGVEHSSNSMLLDDQAEQLVGRARYGALPAGAWGGAPTHRFVATYRFIHQPVDPADPVDARVALR